MATREGASPPTPHNKQNIHWVERIIGEPGLSLPSNCVGASPLEQGAKEINSNQRELE